MNKKRLDVLMAERGLVNSRSQAESYIKLGKVKINGKIIDKPGFLVSEDTQLELTQEKQYVSRAALKLASISAQFKLDFNNSVVLDVGSSTGGFTDFSLQQGASHVIAVEAGKDQLHYSLRDNSKIELHERTDIRDVTKLSRPADIVLIDVSFISLRSVLPHISGLVSKDCQIVAMVKPQFEAETNDIKHKGVIKNDKIRRQIFKDFEDWSKDYFVIKDKADSEVSGFKGNRERFYLLQRN